MGRWNRWRPWLYLLFGALWLVSGIGRYEKGTTGFLLVTPFLISIMSFAAALLWWKKPGPVA